MARARSADEDDPEYQYGCGNPKFTPYDLISFMIVPAILLIIYFACYVKRRNRLTETCGGRPGTVYAVNLLDSYRTRVAHGCAIGVSCVSILDLFFGNYYVSIDYTGVPTMVRGLLSSLVLIANIWLVALVYFPISLCLTTKKKLMGNAFGFAYTIVWTAFYFQKIIECPRDEGRIGELNFLLVAPIFVLYFGLLVQFARGFYRELKKRRDKKRNILHEDPAEYEQFTESHYCQRVVYLLTPKRVLERRAKAAPPSDEKLSCFKKMKRYVSKIYEDEVGFKYSKRMVVTAILAALSLYELGIAYIGGIGLLFDYSEEYFEETGTLYEFFNYTNTTDTFYEIKAFWFILIDCFWPTCVAAMGIAVFFNLHFLYLYRRNTLHLWRGVKTLLPDQELRNSYLVASSLRYSGYHVGFALWGFLILQFLFWVITFVVWFFIIRTIRMGDTNFLVELIRNQWLTAVLALVIYYIQIFLARFFYLEGKGEVLSITNRRGLHNTTYFFMFLNIVLGLLSCLLRIGYSILFGILMVGRIDLCLLMKGFEFWDSGFKSYLAFLQLEVAHTHPVMVSFCYIIWGMMGKRARLDSVDAHDEHFHKKHTKQLQSLQRDQNLSDYGTCRSRRVARNRWHVAYTLVQNPSLVADRSPEALWKIIHGDTGPLENGDSESAANIEKVEMVEIVEEDEPGNKSPVPSSNGEDDGSLPSKTPLDEEDTVDEEAVAMTVVEDTVDEHKQEEEGERKEEEVIMISSEEDSDV